MPTAKVDMVLQHAVLLLCFICCFSSQMPVSQEGRDVYHALSWGSATNLSPGGGANLLIPLPLYPLQAFWLAAHSPRVSFGLR